MLVLGMAALAALSACSALSWFHFGEKDETYDYRKVKTRNQPLEVPPDLTPLAKDDRFNVPAANGASAASAAPAAAPGSAVVAASAAAAAAPGPTGLAVAPTVAAAHIVRDGNQRWLAIDVSPEVAYATVRDLLVSMGYKIEKDEPAVGVLETEWSETRPTVKEDALRNGLHRLLGAFDSNGERNKFRARVERTPANTAEVTITHSGLEEVFTSPAKDTTSWQARPSDPELEAIMLQRLALRFAAVQPVAVAPSAGAPGASASVSAVPADTAGPAPSRVHKVTAGGVFTLQVEDSLEHTWRRVGIALDRGGFTIEERNREKRVYGVRYLDPEYEASEREKRGWWEKIFNADAKIPAQQFLIAVSANGSITVVEVQDKDGKPDSGATARHILDQLNDQLR